MPSLPRQPSTIKTRKSFPSSCFKPHINTHVPHIWPVFWHRFKLTLHHPPSPSPLLDNSPLAGPELRHRLHPADRRTSATAAGHRATAPQCRAQRATPRRKEAVAQHHLGCGAMSRFGMAMDGHCLGIHHDSHHGRGATGPLEVICIEKREEP